MSRIIFWSFNLSLPSNLVLSAVKFANDGDKDGVFKNVAASFLLQRGQNRPENDKFLL